MGEDGRVAVAKLQREIENFLVDDEAPDYIRHKKRDLERKITMLERLAQRQAQSLYIGHPSTRYPQDPNFNYDYDYGDSSGPIKNAFHDLFREDYDYASILQEQGYNEEYAERTLEIQDRLKRELVQALSNMIDAHGVLQRKCEFFTTSLLKNHGRVQYSCERAQSTLNESMNIAKALKETSFAERNMFTLSLVYEKRPNYVSDWVASIAYSLERDLEQL